MKRELSEEAKGFQEDFTLALRLLRSTEKVQISTLTDLVAENRAHASVAVECIKHRIRTAPVEPENEVLPAVYLMDCVVKILKGEFVTLFAEGLFELFMEAFNRMLNGRTRLCHVLETWKGVFPQETLDKIWAALPAPPPLPGAPGGGVAAVPAPVPPVGAYRAPMDGFGGGGGNMFLDGRAAKRPHVDHVEEARLREQNLLEIQNMWNELSNRVRTQGYPATADQRAQFAQLEQMRRELLPAPAAYALPPQQPAPLPPMQFFQPPQQIAPLPPVGVGGPILLSPLLDTLRQMAARTTQPMGTGFFAQQQPTAPLPPLQKQQQQRAPPQQQAQPKLYANKRAPTSYLPAVNERPSSLSARSENEFRSGPPTILMKTDFRDLHIFNSRALEPLYRGAGKACPNCALRFPSQEVYNQHMDWHFKQNAREKSRLSRGQSRAWFSSASNWHNDIAGDAASVAVAANVFTAKNNEHQAQDAAGGTVGDTGLPASRVPADEEHAACAICTERFDRAWDETEGIWVFEGAMRCANNAICHSECFAGATDEAKAKLAHAQ